MALGNAHIVWTPGTTLEQIERQAIELASAFFRGNKSTTARALGISVRTIETKLKKYAADDRDQLRIDHDIAEDRKRLLAAQRGEVYEPIPYVEPAETPEADDVEVEEDVEDAPKTFAQQAKRVQNDPPPVIPAGGQLSAKIVGAR